MGNFKKNLAIILPLLFLALTFYADYKANRAPDPPKNNLEIMMDSFNQRNKVFKENIEKFDSIKTSFENNPYVKELLDPQKTQLEVKKDSINLNDEKDRWADRVMYSPNNKSQIVIDSDVKLKKSLTECEFYRMYGEIKICLPKIDGMNEAYSFPQVMNRTDLFSYDNNTILGLYLNEEDFSSIDNFENESLDDYFKVYALKFAEGIEIGKSEFEELIESSKGNFLETSWEKIIDRVTSGTDNLSVGIPVKVDSYRPTEDIFTIVLLIKMIAGQEERIAVSTLNMVSVKNTVVFYAYYRNYKSAKTLEQAKAKSDFFGYKLLEINQSN